MTDKRKLELFDNAISWIWEHTENHGKSEYVNALKCIGYTPQEIDEELFECNFCDEGEEY